MSKLAIVLSALSVICALDRTLVGAESSPAPAASPAAAQDAPAAQTPTTTESGLQYVDTKVGTGAGAKVGQTVSIKYTIFIKDSKIEERSVVPMTFTIGKDQALKGLDEGVRTMKLGGQRKLTVPPNLAYGAEGAKKVPPNSTLTIDVELVEIK
jgi:peptidylprolyl isomerase